VGVRKLAAGSGRVSDLSERFKLRAGSFRVCPMVSCWEQEAFGNVRRLAAVGVVFLDGFVVFRIVLLLFYII
jgi:hypothetical protein